MTKDIFEIAKNAEAATIETAQYKQALEDFDWIIQLKKIANQTRGIVMTGQSGVGKTKILQSVVAKYPPVNERNRLRHQVIMFGMPANPTISGLCKSILDRLEQPYPAKCPEADLTRLVKIAIKGIEPYLLIIDEAQHLIEGNRLQKKAAQTADWVKQLMNDTGVSIALVGMPNTEILTEKNDQLRRRFSRRRVIKPYKADRKGERERLLNAIKALLAEFGYEGDSSFIEKPTPLKRLCIATDGRLGLIVPLLIEAIRLSFDENNSALTENHFFNAFENEIWSQAKEVQNPFSKQFSKRSLKDMGEPFVEYQGGLC